MKSKCVAAKRACRVVRLVLAAAIVLLSPWHEAGNWYPRPLEPGGGADLLSAGAARAQGLPRDFLANWPAAPDSSRFAGRSGWDFPGSGAEERPDGYVLLSRYDGDIRRHVVELVDVRSSSVANRFEVHSETLLGDWQSSRRNDIAAPDTPGLYRAVHPYLLENGDLLFKDHYSPLIRVSSCGQLVWRNEEADFHHALERGPDGTIWTSTRAPLAALGDMAASVNNMGIANVSPNGRMLYHRSLGDVLIAEGLGHLVVDEWDFSRDPLHLNDVQPVMDDGPNWSRGDVFLSFRNLSMVALFRPSTDEFVWMQQGPWRGQHDVDIVDDHTIAVFDNHVMNLGDGARVRGTNRIALFDFATGETS